MIPAFLLARVARMVGDKWAKPAIYGVLAALLLTGLGIAKCRYDRSIIAAHDTTRALKQSQADRKADAQAAEERRDDDARLANETQSLGRINTDAENDADRRLARMRCIRLQQAARRDGRLSPACG